MNKRLSDLLILHKLNQQDEEKFHKYTIAHNQKRIKWLCIFIIVLETFLLMTILFNILPYDTTVYPIIFSFLALGIVGYTSIAIVNKFNKIFFLSIINDLLPIIMLLMSVFLTRNNLIENDTNIMLFFITIFAFSAMLLNKPIKAIIILVLVFLLLLFIVGIHNADLLSRSIIMNSIASVGLAITTSIILYNKELYIFIKNIENEKFNEKLTIMANTDLLTGIYNRRSMDTVIKSQVDHFLKEDAKLSLMIIDIDYFKNINDHYGHPIGDEVLIDFSDLIRNSLRPGDTVGRWGGEEFIVICNNTESRDAVILAERLKNIINEHEFTNGIKINASFGVSQMKIDMSIRDLISQADQALYKAKEDGRNRVEVA